jgi:Ner family transcriptional regulator
MSGQPIDWHWEQVKSAIRMRGVTLEELSILLGYRGRANVAIVGIVAWPKVQAGIASFLNMRPQDIWPSRYDAEGKPVRKPRSDRGERKTRRRVETPQKQEAV